MRKVLLTIVAIGVLNFAVFAIGAWVLHGDAVGTHPRCPPGDYVENKGVCHQVSHAAYLFSKISGYSAIISMVLAMGASLILEYQKASAAVDPPQSS